MAIRLSQDAWAAIRQAYQAGMTARELAREHGISASAIYKKAHARGWANSSADISPLETLSREIGRLIRVIEAATCKEAA